MTSFPVGLPDKEGEGRNVAMMIPWASIEDAIRADADSRLYGAMYIVQGDDGLYRHVDATSVLPEGSPSE